MSSWFKFYQNLPIRTKIFSVFIVLIILALFQLVVVLYTSRETINAQNNLNNVQIEIDKTRTIQNQMLSARNGITSASLLFLVNDTEDFNYKIDLENSYQESASALKVVEKVIDEEPLRDNNDSHNEEDHSRFDEIKINIEQYQEYLLLIGEQLGTRGNLRDWIGWCRNNTTAKYQQ